jgi:mannan endo-1,4-beta-mannosidase
VTGFEDAADKLTFTIDSEATQLYDLSIRVAAIYGEKRTSVILNGGASSEVLFPAADDWADIAGGQLLLNAGDNTVDIVTNWGWYVPQPSHVSASPH